ncbi:MAG: phospholipase D-like domain-containing protein, partial [Thermoplasmata archaeon]
GRITLHMNFSQPILNNNGDELLLDSGGIAHDFFAYGPDSSVDYPPLGIHWEGRDLAARENQSLALFPNGKVVGEPKDWFPLPSTPGASNGDSQPGEDGILLTEVHYNNLRDNEYFCIYNRGNWVVNLTGWIVTDLEGEITFPERSSIGLGQTLCVTYNSTSYFEDLLKEADFTYSYGNAGRMTSYGGKLALRNEGDEVALLTPYGREVDAFAWGNSEASLLGWQGEPAATVRKGAIAKRLQVNGAFVDTNASHDWESLRDFGMGQSDFKPVSFTVSGPVISFYSPSISLGVVKEQIGRASGSILLNAYQFTSRALSDELVRAVTRDVDVRILIEGQPVGGVNSKELWLLENLTSAGARVRFLMDMPEDDIFKRYVYNHAKYVVIDNTTLMISSENWGDNGYPEDGAGNRGWGVVIEDEPLAAYFARVFYEDWNPLRRDSLAFDYAVERLISFKDEEPFQGHELLFADELKVTDDVEVVAVVGPDNAMNEETILELIGSAEERIYVEQFYLRRTWKVSGGIITNPFLNGLIDAAERGCEVKVLLDPTWYNVLREDTNDNDDTVDFLNSLESSGRITISAKLMNLEAHGLLKLHNKGVVVDGNRVLISSLNWNYNSFARNREVGVIIRNEKIGAYFEQIFLHDWKDDVTPPIARIEGDQITTVGETIMLSALGSFDDSGLAHFSWDIDADGLEDSNDSAITISFDTLGTFLIRLEVKDGWGNSNVTTLTIVVKQKDSRLEGEYLILLVLVSAIAPAALFYQIRRRRTKDI